MPISTLLSEVYYKLSFLTLLHYWPIIKSHQPHLEVLPVSAGCENLAETNIAPNLTKQAPTMIISALCPYQFLPLNCHSLGCFSRIKKISVYVHTAKHCQPIIRKLKLKIVP